MRCTGACCERFTISLSLADLVLVKDRDESADIARVLCLVRPLIHDTDTSAGSDYPPEYPSMRYRCTAWDRETRRCLQYDNRPEMCRTYPNGFECHHCGSRSEQEARGVAIMSLSSI